MVTPDESAFLHELAHAAHYRIDKDAHKQEKWQKELIAELSAAAFSIMLGKEPKTGNHYRYIKKFAEEAELPVIKACMKVLDTCISVINEIIEASDVELTLSPAA